MVGNLDYRITSNATTSVARKLPRRFNELAMTLKSWPLCGTVEIAR
jgi:hypothetical protein